MTRQIRTEGDLIKVNDWLLPLSWLYGFGVGLRNLCFDWGLLKQRVFDIPVISVGNITVGGAGKTPHVEYLIRLLQNIMKVGVLSRGYKRKSKGYVLADTDTPMSEIGDEPFQMKRKFPNTYVAVDKNRCHGIDTMTSDPKTNNVDVILLDDAFQHRYVKPGINILLVDYHRLIIYDKLLPAGRLREPLSGKNRADMVIVTKCPKDLKPMEFRVLTKAMNLYPYQQLFFTTIEYCEMKPVFGPKNAQTENLQKFNPETLAGKNVLLITGIASPQQMENDVAKVCRSIQTLRFRDHHNFSDKDVERINLIFEEMENPKVIVTTEKDASRLLSLEGLSKSVHDNLYTIPIRVSFMLNQEELFNQKIISYVKKNSRNSILFKEKDSSKSQDKYSSGRQTGTISFRNN